MPAPTAQLPAARAPVSDVIAVPLPRLAEPAPGPELPPGPPTPPDMELVMKTAAEYGLEILGPPGIPA